MSPQKRDLGHFTCLPAGRHFYIFRHRQTRLWPGFLNSSLKVVVKLLFPGYQKIGTYIGLGESYEGKSKDENF